MLTTQLLAAVLAVGPVGETVLLDFQADWCGPCKMMEPTINQLAAMGYPVRKVNIDHEPALAQRYGVTNIPCFVVVVDGQEKGRQVGSTSRDELLRMAHMAGMRPAGAAVAQVRGQSPDRRGLGWPRSRPSAEKSGLQPPTVDLGQPVAMPAATRPPNATRPPTATAAPPLQLISQPSVSPRVAPAVHTPEPGGAKAPGVAPPPQPLSRTLADRLIASSVRLRIKDADGHNLGSGTIIEFRPAGTGGEALIVTCGHIFRDTEGKGPIQVDLFDGSGQQNLPGELVRYDLGRDIGLVKVAVNHPVPPIQLAPPTTKPQRGHKVMTVGCDYGRDPTLQRSHVMAINTFVGPPNLQVAGQPAVGRSGGGLFNEQGQLIGICNFADPTDRAGLYAAVDVARQILGQAGLMPAAHHRGQQIADWDLQSQPRTDIGGSVTPPGGNAALQPVARVDGSSADVICIVRGTGTGDEDPKVIVIKNASPDLLKRLANEQHKQQGSIPTTLEVTRKIPAPVVPPREVIRTTTDWNPTWR